MKEENPIAYLCKLSRLELTAEEQQKFQQELDTIVRYFDRLQEVDTQEAEFLSQAVADLNMLRTDEPQNSWQAKNILKNAAEKQGNCFQVPKILEG